MPDENDILFNQYSIDWSALISALLNSFSSNAPSAAEVAAFFDVLWLSFFVISLLVAAACFIGYVYAAIRFNQLAEAELEGLREQERLYQQLFGGSHPSRFDDIKTHVASDNPNDWKLAVIEADIELEKALDGAGYTGATIGERLKSIQPGQIATLDDAWEAHKVRNRIAHDGADFVLTKKLAQETITRYERVFAELGHR